MIDDSATNFILGAEGTLPLASGPLPPPTEEVFVLLCLLHADPDDLLGVGQRQDARL